MKIRTGRPAPSSGETLGCSSRSVRTILATVTFRGRHSWREGTARAAQLEVRRRFDGRDGGSRGALGADRAVRAGARQPRWIHTTSQQQARVGISRAPSGIVEPFTDAPPQVQRFAGPCRPAKRFTRSTTAPGPTRRVQAPHRGGGPTTKRSSCAFSLLPGVDHVHMYAEPINIRWGERKLGQISREEMGIDTADGGVFLFDNRAKDQIRLFLPPRRRRLTSREVGARRSAFECRGQTPCPGSTSLRRCARRSGAENQPGTSTWRSTSVFRAKHTVGSRASAEAPSPSAHATERHTRKG